MSSATMTLIGLYNFAPYYNKDLFKNLTLPDELDKQTAIDNILLFCGENEVLYPDLDFNIDMIKMWSTKWQRTFQKWVELFGLEYNPIENYDRMEAWSDSHSLSSNDSHSMSSSDSHSLSSSESNSASASDSSYNSNSMKDDVSAFNVSTYSPASASAGNNRSNASSISVGENKHGEIGDNKHGELSQNKHGELALDSHRGRVHGNIGVTTTQQMMQQEIDIQKFNIYDEIAIIFAREFTLAL